MVSNSSSIETPLSGIAEQTLTAKYWVRRPGFDLSLIMGGAYLTLLVAFFSFQYPDMLPVLFWVWVVGFEGSHFWATFSRTYFDKKFISENKKILIGSLVFFAFPAMALLLDAQSTISYTTIYGFFIFVWSLYHNARQHYGFTSIYCAKADISGDLKGQVIKSLYFSIIFSQIHFLMNFKLTGTFALSDLPKSNASLSWIISDLPVLLTGFACIYFLVVTFRLLKEKGTVVVPTIIYIATCLIFYSTMFYILAPMDQFIQTTSGAQALILIAIMNSLFHNIQYHAIVWHYGQSRYTSGEKEKNLFGLAHFINYKPKNYLLFALVMGGIFAFIVWSVGDSPDLNGSFVHNKPHDWAYILFFGIIGHHFYLDQKIWRPSQQKDLKNYLS